MIEFQVEWEEAHDIRDDILARTWANLSIVIENHVVTRLLDSRTDGIRAGVYGSVFPLAEWIVENWWPLLHESRRTADDSGGRQLVGRGGLQEWGHRHCVLAAREGNSLPDLTFYRDEDRVVASWFPDLQTSPSWPVRFLSEPRSLPLRPDEVEGAFVRFVEIVIDRLADRQDADSARLMTNWSAVKASSREEPRLCSWSASLGLDPYDPEELTDDLIDLFEGRVASLGEEIRADLLDVAAKGSLADDLDWVDEAKGRAEAEPSPAPTADQAPLRVGYARMITAHDRGYERAKDVRTRLGLGPSERLDGLEDRLGEILGHRPHTENIRLSLDRKLDGLVWRDRGDVPLFVAPPSEPTSSRFRLARALHFWMYAEARQRPRLLTKSFTSSQRESRAFAAELLAPAEALRSHGLEGPVSASDVDHFASAYQVSPWVIYHQLRNHRIGRVEFT